MSDRMEMFDDETPDDAVVAAWLDEGPNTTRHRAARHRVRELMPLLGRALDRLAEQKVEQVLGGEQFDASVPVSVLSEERVPDQSWFWTDEWQEGEREADEDIRAGRIWRFLSGKDFVDSLTKGDDDGTR